MPDTQRCWEMFHNSQNGISESELQPSVWPDRERRRRERETGGEKTESDWFLLIHNDKMDKMVEQVASASFVGLLAGIY